MSDDDSDNATETLLSADNVTKRFDGIRALSDVTIEVGKAECVGLIGPNGAGKTTLFDCVTGRITPDQGEIQFRGTRLNGKSGVMRAKLGMARTFQRMELFSGMSVADHLLVAAQARSSKVSLWRDLFGQSRVTDEDQQVVDTVLDGLRLREHADRAIESLTLGQARVVELARALACQPFLLMLDEPSSGLDRHETEQMTGVLEAVREMSDVSILLIEHDVPTVRTLASRLYVLDAGRMVASGETEQTLSHPDVRAAYLGVNA